MQVQRYLRQICDNKRKGVRRAAVAGKHQGRKRLKSEVNSDTDATVTLSAAGGYSRKSADRLRSVYGSVPDLAIAEKVIFRGPVFLPDGFARDLLSDFRSVCLKR